ncbi:MAG: hypothetical protein L0Y66_06825 [Myxococcaceae bacterium]|nr:hypothetical protein [Myxococcaceae bacterium]MCI0669554.1 hypothetical protein [Myxococcaceae bacterium]
MPAADLIESAIRGAIRNEVKNQLDPLRTDIEALAETFSTVSALVPTLRMLASMPDFLGANPGVAQGLPRGRAAAQRAAPVARPAAKRPRIEESARGCAVIGCDRPHRSRGYCGAHYQQRRNLMASGRLPSSWREDAAPQTLQPISLPRGGARRGSIEGRDRTDSTARACAVIGCRRPHRSRGYCGAHYQRRRLLESSGRLPASWSLDVAPQSVPEVILPRGRRPRGEAREVKGAVQRQPSNAPRAWVRKRGQTEQPLAPLSTLVAQELAAPSVPATPVVADTSGTVLAAELLLSAASTAAERMVPADPAPAPSTVDLTQGS